MICLTQGVISILKLELGSVAYHWMAIISRISTIITVTYGAYDDNGLLNLTIYLWFTCDSLMIHFKS